jgi:DNA-binding NarL/FixJ family response regulator
MRTLEVRELVMNVEPVRILIADGHPIVREGLKAALTRVTAFEVVAEAGDGYATLLGVRSHRPHLLLLDAHMDGIDAFDTITRAISIHPDLKVLVSYLSENPFEVRQLVRAGACGFIGKTASAPDFCNAVQTIIGGASYFSQSITTALFGRDGPSPAPHLNVLGLSMRETEVLRYIASGFSNKDIARRLDLSVRTVETHRLNIRKKTNAGRFRDLVLVARKLNLQETDPSAQKTAAINTSDTMLMQID